MRGPGAAPSPSPPRLSSALSSPNPSTHPRHSGLVRHRPTALPQLSGPPVWVGSECQFAFSEFLGAAAAADAGLSLGKTLFAD